MSLTRKYRPTPAGPGPDGQEWYEINYVDKCAGFSPEPAIGPKLPLNQAKEKANELTQQYHNDSTRR